MYVHTYACMYGRMDGHLRPALLGQLCQRVDLSTEPKEVTKEVCEKDRNTCTHTHKLPGDGVPQTDIWFIFIQEILTFFAWLLVHLQTQNAIHKYSSTIEDGIQHAFATSTACYDLEL